MIALAFDCATDRCTVAASCDARVAHRHLDGARGHATAILSLLDEVLAEVGATVRDVGLLVTGDGPGSFTGLRVATSVAKGITWGRAVEWRVAPSLLVRAAGHVGEGEVVAGVSDALRGEIYAGCWRFAEGAVQQIGGAPRAIRPEALTRFGPVARVVGSIPAALEPVVAELTGSPLVSGLASLPDARQLLRLATLAGGTTRVDDAAAWEPEYGRPAEAQAVWERAHGRALPTAPGISR